jgi:hypothetical protein
MGDGDGSLQNPISNQMVQKRIVERRLLSPRQFGD